jgi:hypothetical protein
MRPFQSAYIGRHEFPRGLGEFELRQWFTFGVRERRVIRKGPQAKIGKFSITRSEISAI